MSGTGMPNGRCRMHGEPSTGPRTPEGLEAIRRSRTVHGFYSRRALEQRRQARATRRLLAQLLDQLPHPPPPPAPPPPPGMPCTCAIGQEVERRLDKLRVCWRVHALAKLRPGSSSLARHVSLNSTPTSSEMPPIFEPPVPGRVIKVHRMPGHYVGQTEPVPKLRLRLPRGDD